MRKSTEGLMAGNPPEDGGECAAADAAQEAVAAAVQQRLAFHQRDVVHTKKQANVAEQVAT